MRSRAFWQKPASDKGSAAQEEKQLRPGKPDLAAPRDGDRHKAGKEAGKGFTGNAAAVLVRGDNPSAQEYRRPSEHRYQGTDYGQGSGQSKLVMQNRLAAKRK